MAKSEHSSITVKLWESLNRHKVCPSPCLGSSPTLLRIPVFTLHQENASSHKANSITLCRGSLHFRGSSIDAASSSQPAAAEKSRPINLRRVSKSVAQQPRQMSTQMSAQASLPISPFSQAAGLDTTSRSPIMSYGLQKEVAASQAKKQEDRTSWSELFTNRLNQFELLSCQNYITPLQSRRAEKRANFP